MSGMVELVRDHGVPIRPGARELLAEVAAAGLPHALVTSSERRSSWTRCWPAPG